MSELTVEQLKQFEDIVRKAIRDELGSAGLRVDEANHVDEARKDFMFLRKIRGTWESAVNKVGNAVLFGLVAIVATIGGTGFWAWLQSGGK